MTNLHEKECPNHQYNFVNITNNNTNNKVDILSFIVNIIPCCSSQNFNFKTYFFLVSSIVFIIYVLLFIYVKTFYSSNYKVHDPNLELILTRRDRYTE